MTAGAGRRRRRPLPLPLAALWLLLAAGTAAAEPSAFGLETVLPALPGKNRVRWWEFDWRSSRFSPVDGGAPVELFFYESERGIARLVLPPIAEAYRDLVEVFDFAPDQTIPFLLYNSHFEFESTTAFFISETVLGVTSTQDLTMALPYWGERRRFGHVMRHELVHQFQIQKILAAARQAGSCNPLPLLPLWFIEGTAELLSLGELTPEVRATLADRLLPGEPALPDFFAIGPRSYERIYLLGHAQVRFLEERYGEGTVQRVLEGSPALCRQTAGFFTNDPTAGFQLFLAELTGEGPDLIRAAWRDWARRQVEGLPEEPFEGVEIFGDELGAGRIDSFSLAPDGRTLLYRTVDRDTGVARLYLRDLEDPESRRLVTQDQRLGLASLHPTGRRVTAVGADRLVYLGRRGATDAVFVRRYRREEAGGRVRFELLEEEVFELGDAFALIEGGTPAIDPVTGAVAFSGLSRRTGFLDVYRLEQPFEAARLVQVTDDAYAEVGLAYQPDGTLLFASDATPEARFEIARLEGGRRVLLTDFGGRTDATSPAPSPGGGFVFDSGATGRVQAWRGSDAGLVRLTEVPTSLQSPAVDHRGGLLGLALMKGATRLVRLPRERLVSVPSEARPTEPVEPWPVNLGELGEVQEYRPLSNLQLESVTGLVSGGPLVLGSLVFADTFRSHLLGLSVEILGDLDLTDAELFYLDRSGRWVLGLSAYLDSGLQLRPLEQRDRIDSYLLQRFGARVAAEYPFGQFSRVSGFVSPLGIRANGFSSPGSPFAQATGGLFPAVQVGAGLAIDTTRVAIVGPVGGWALGVSTAATWVFGGPDPFLSATGELRASQPLRRGYERLYLTERLAVGGNFGGGFAEQYYLPASYNLRAFREGSLPLLGDGYYLGQLELHFPLAPVLARTLYLQGVVGVDAGAIFFEWRNAFERRVANAVLGANLGLGPLILRLQWARPFSLGAGVPVERWIFHLSIVTPFGALF